MKLLTTVVLAAATLTASAQSPQLQPVLDKLDRASATFKSVQADVAYDTYVKVVRDHTRQTGKLYIERNGKANTMGAVFYDPSSSSPAKVLNYDGGTLQIFTPGTNQVDVFAAGANQAKYESFLTLGFGGSGKDLYRAWDITDMGPENVNGVRAEKLDLVSKDPSVRQMFTHVTIWLDLAQGLSVRQIFFQPDGDSRTADYTNIQRDKSIDNRKLFTIPKKGPTRIAH